MCIFNVQDFPHDHLADETCARCGVLMDLHNTRPEVIGGKTYRHDPKAFPIFEIGKTDAARLLKSFEDALLLQSTPSHMWNIILKQQVNTTKDWIDNHSSLRWTGTNGMRESFMKQVTPGDYVEMLSKRDICMLHHAHCLKMK